MTIPNEIKVTTEVLWQGAILFALMDFAFLIIILKLIKIEPIDLFEIKWSLVAFIGIFFCAIWGILVSYLFWESVYSYVFPAWARWLIPPVYGLLFAAVGLLTWWLAVHLPGNSVISFCILGGVWGIMSHIWAISRGILEKPPMLQGASPISAIVIAMFEFIFYWCVCLSIVFLAGQIKKRLRA
jgi:hypothetical protein